MITSTRVLEMEETLKESLSLGFFEHGAHSVMDLEIYPAYHAVLRLRMLLEAYEGELKECVEEIKEECRDYDFPDNADDEADQTLKVYDLMDKLDCDMETAKRILQEKDDE